MFDGKYDHLLGRNFSYDSGGDCLKLACDYFKDFHDITINNDYARYEGWERDGLNLFADNYEAEGFQLLELQRGTNWSQKLQDGDVLLMSLHGSSDRVATGVANHCAIWLEPRMILHHMYGRKSEIIPFRFKNSTTHILRHKDIPTKEKHIEEINILDILPARKRELLINARRATE